MPIGREPSGSWVWNFIGIGLRQQSPLKKPEPSVTTDAEALCFSTVKEEKVTCVQTIKEAKATHACTIQDAETTCSAAIKDAEMQGASQA